MAAPAFARSEQLAELAEEARVLRGVPNVTRSAPSRPRASPARTSTPRSARPRTTRASTSAASSPSPGGRTRRSSPATRRARCPSSRSPSSSSMRSAIVRSTRAVTSSWWCSASTAGGLRGGVAEERLAHLVDRGAEVLGAAQGEADAQPAQPVDLREGPQEHEVRVPLEQVERRVGVVEHVELAVGLVEDHADVARDAARRTPRSRRAAPPSTSGCSGCRRSRRRVATVISSAIASRSWRWSASSGDARSRGAPDAAARCG